MADIDAPRPPRFEHRTDKGVVLGLGVATPRLSWTMAQAYPGYRQSAYEIEINCNGTRRSYSVEGDAQVLVPWPAPPLRSREVVSVRVRVAAADNWSDWSEPSVAEAGLLDVDDWQGSFITPADIADINTAAPLLRGRIELPADEVRSARLYATAHGIYVPSINGTRVGDASLAPGWTSYDHRLRYQVYDVTHLISPGLNELEVLLGNGWYRGRLGFTGERALYGDHLALLAQLEVTTRGGTVHVLATDASWTAHESEILADDLYDGQRTDLRRRASAERLSDGAVEVVPASLERLVAPEGPPVRATEVVPARDMWTSPSGRTLVDFGQNLVGWTRLKVRDMTRGTEVVIRHAEVLEDAELGTRPLRSAAATDSFLLAGEGEELLEPSLTLHGFRYVEIVGVPNLRVDDIEAVVVGTDLRRVGWFSSSHKLLDQFHENVVWSTRGNFVDVPTDCPQRDERLGWTGDIQVFAPTASFLFDSSGFLSSWLADLAAEQLPDGSVPHVVPDVIRTRQGSSPAAAWGDAATVVPWTLYWRTGDVGILDRQYASMRAWVDKISDIAGPDRLWTGGFQYGDWLDPAAPEDQPGLVKADPDVVATAHLARSAQIVADAAAILGRAEESIAYGTLASEVRDAFARAYVTAQGRVLSDCETVYSLAIEWDLLPSEEQRRGAGRRLADLVRASGFRISTGFVGTPLVCDALTSTGNAELAYRLLLQTECPSWLYPVTMGATTVWERWDSMRPDGSINPGGMTSFNHYALGAVADWLHRNVAGLAALGPGYREIAIQPLVTDALSSASARHLTPYGEATVGWERKDGVVEVSARVPVGVTARVRLPGAATTETVGHGDHRWRVLEPTHRSRRGKDPRTIRDVFDDSAAWSAVIATAAAHGVDEVLVARRLARHLDAPAEQLADRLTLEEHVPGALALRRSVAETIGPILNPEASASAWSTTGRTGAPSSTEREDA
jgi:alpha-L-rhamnosidase